MKQVYPGAEALQSAKPTSTTTSLPRQLLQGIITTIKNVQNGQQSVSKPLATPSGKR